MIKEVYISEMVIFIIKYKLNLVVEYMNDTMKNCPSSDFDCISNSIERFMWDGYKAKYYFKENSGI